MGVGAIVVVIDVVFFVVFCVVFRENWTFFGQIPIFHVQFR